MVQNQLSSLVDAANVVFALGLIVDLPAGILLRIGAKRCQPEYNNYNEVYALLHFLRGKLNFIS